MAESRRSEKVKAASMERVQHHPGSVILRHESAFQFIVERCRRLGRPVSILSFGCSWGAELTSFALQLPDSKFLGVELDELALKHATSIFADTPQVDIARSDWNVIARHAPYDAILCNAVLCRFPDSKKMEDLSELYPYSTFEEQIRRLDSMLLDGGSLCAYNTNYRVTECELTSKYECVPFPPTLHIVPHDNFVPLFGKDCRKLIHRDATFPNMVIDIRAEEKRSPIEITAILNEGFFIKNPSTADLEIAAARRAALERPRPAGSDVISIPLTSVYRIEEPHADRYNRISIDQTVQSLNGGTELSIGFWWGGQALSPEKRLNASLWL